MLALPTAFVVALLLASSAQAADRVYWANGGSESANRISWANLDGSDAGNLNTGAAPAGQPRGVAMDVAAGRVYWTARINNLISFTNLDGSGGGGNLNTMGATVSTPNAAAVHPAAGKIYWANEAADTISVANLDNSGGGSDLITSSIGRTVDIPIAPVVDPNAGRIYWGNGGSVNKISFANLDGSGGGDLNTEGATVNNPHGLALDPVANTVYWANIGSDPLTPATASPTRELDGSGGGDLDHTGATLDVPVGVAIDPSARKIYWANQGEATGSRSPIWTEAAAVTSPRSARA